MLKHLTIAAPAALFFSAPAFAQEVRCDGVTTNNNRAHLTVFINGILNSEEEACQSLGSLRTLVDTDAEQSDFDLFYNPSQKGTKGFLGDMAELGIQAATSSRARDIAENDYTIRINGASARYNFVLGKLYVDKLEANQYKSEIEREVYIRANLLYGYLVGQIRRGKSITVVAHSQGNFYIEAAIAIMHYRGEQDIINKILVVGVAPVSSSTPNDTYFSLQEDRAVALHRVNTSPLSHFTVLPANATACVGRLMSNTCDQIRSVSESDWFTHSFTDIYLNPNLIIDGIPISTRIRDQVVRARYGLLPAHVNAGPILGREVSVSRDHPAYFELLVSSTAYRNSVAISIPYRSDRHGVQKYILDYGNGTVEETETIRTFRMYVGSYSNQPARYTVSVSVVMTSGAVYTCQREVFMDGRTNTAFAPQKCFSPAQ